MFWTGQEMGLGVLARVPETGNVYPLLGRPHDSLPMHDSAYNVSVPIYKGAHYDASTTNLTYAIPSHNGSSDPTEITISFLSPITPTSTVRQSLPAAYISVHVTGPSNIDIYIDLNGQWVSGDRGKDIVWDFAETLLGGDIPSLKTWRVKRRDEQHLTEFQDRAEWGTLLFSAPSSVSYESGTSALLRQHFARKGPLRNKIDNKFRKIMDEEPVFAFSYSFPMNSTNSRAAQTQSIVFTVAHIQDPVVQYASARGMTMMKPLWMSYFLSVEKLLTFHYLDYRHAKSLAKSYSDQLAIDAYASGADDYVDIVALSARQVLGATSFSGTPDDPILFLKEISSNGNFQTIDVIFPAFPFFLYTNPRWLAYILEPLIEHMLSGQYPNKYAMHDLGAHFPNATGHPDGRDEYMPVEECGNILIMGLALANSLNYSPPNKTSFMSWRQTSPVRLPDPSLNGIFSLDTGKAEGVDYIDSHWRGGPLSENAGRRWVDRSYKLWKQWTQYLVDFSLEPANQLSTDDFAGWLALQTNLALKGIIGIKAMEGLAKLTDNKADAKMYQNISETYIAKWEEYGVSRDKTHAKLAYDWWGSWTTTYNLYADSLLCFHLGNDTATSTIAAGTGSQKPLKDIKGDHEGFVPKHIYQMQSDWYYSVRQKYGLPLDSRHLYTKTDWEFFAMAVAAPRVRGEILESVAKWLNETETDRPFTDLHKTEGNGGFPGPNFFARPVVGGHFAFLTLKEACGGKAEAGLDFLDDSVVDHMNVLDVPNLLMREMLDNGDRDTFEL